MGKHFKSGMDSLLGSTTNKAKTAKRGRPKTNHKEVTKTSQVGTKENETRATFIVNEAQLEDLKALAYYDRKTIKDVLAEAIGSHLDQSKKSLAKARALYNG